MNAAHMIAVSSVALLAACAQQPPRHNVTVDKQQDCPVSLHTGQNLILSLPSNPTTGFRWLVQNPAQSVLRSLGPEVYNNPQDAGIVGNGGQSVWRFQAQHAGAGTLLLVYQQPWAPEVKPTQTFECAIDVK